MPILDALTVYNLLLERFGNRSLKRIARSVYRVQHLLREMEITDPELRDICQHILVDRSHNHPRLRAVMRSVHTVQRVRSDLEPTTLLDLAIGVEVFRRAPANLDDHAELRAGQVQAAAGLLQNLIIKMDTGEGKTYAILPAAFALAAQFPNVYIVCANDYLAGRDALRTRRFWEFATGAPAGFGINAQEYEAQWSRRVVYTTLVHLAVKIMSDEALSTPPRFPVTTGAVLVDDADAVLIDGQAQQLSTPLPPLAEDWARWLSISDRLQEPETVTVQRGDRVSARLTVAGEAMLRGVLTNHTSDTEFEYLRARDAVERSYEALRLVREGADFVVVRDAIVAISPRTGLPDPYNPPPWLAPLQVHRQMPLSLAQATVHRLDPGVLIRRFAVRSGISGTVGEDAAEYHLRFSMRYKEVQRNRPRYPGSETTLCFVKRRAAVAGAARLAVEAAIEGRPVLLGTHSVTDAEECYKAVRDAAPENVRIQLLTIRNEYEAPQIIEGAGQPATITVATQIAGRGVDIELRSQHPEGLCVIGLGRSYLAREDKQFLGRAGRQQDPFSAYFIMSSEDAIFAASPFKGLRDRLPDIDEPVPVPGLARAIRLAQERAAREIIVRGRQRVLLDAIDARIGQEITQWFESSRSMPDASADGAACSPDVIDLAIRRLFSTPEMRPLSQRRELTGAQLDSVIGHLSEVLGLVGDTPDKIRRRGEINDLLADTPGRSARDQLTSALRAWVDEAAQRNARSRSGNDDAVGSEIRATSALVNRSAVAFTEHTALARAMLPPVSRKVSIESRTQRAAVHWAIGLSWRRYLLARGLQSDSLWRSDLSAGQANRSLTNYVDDLWSREEATIPGAVLSAALSADRPSQLDEVFAVDDARALTTVVSAERMVAIARAANFERVAPFQRTPTDVSGQPQSLRVLVDQFVEQHEGGSHDAKRTRQIRQALLDFADNGDLDDLRTPQLVQRRLRAWREREEDAGVEAKRLPANRAWIKNYIEFLHHLGYVKGWPGRRIRAAEALRRSVAVLRRALVIVPVLGAVGYAALFVALSMIHIGSPRGWPAWLSLADAAATGGTGRAGAVTATVAASMSIGVAITALLGHRGYERSRPLMIVVPSAAFIGLTWWMYHGEDWTRIVILASIICSAAFLAITLLALSAIELSSGIRLIPLLLWYGSSVALVAALRPWLPVPAALAYAAVGSAVVVLAIFRTINRSGLEVVSLVSDRVQATQTVLSIRHISGAVGLTTYIGSAVVSYALAQVVAIVIGVQVGKPIDEQTTGIITLGAYGVILIIVVATQIARRSGLGVWQAILNRSQLVLSTRAHPNGLASTLRSARWRLTVVEISSQLVVLAGVSLLLRWNTVAASDVPISLVVAVAATVAAEQIRIFVGSIYELVVRRGPVSSAFLELVPEQTPIDQSRFMRVLRRLGGLAIPLGLILIWLSRALDAAQVISFLRNLFGL